MAETRKLAAILAADVVGYSKLAGSDEERTLARLRALRSDLFDPTIAVHHGRVFKRTGDGVLIEFRSVVDAVRCTIEVQNDMVERNAVLPPERRIEFRVGIHLGDWRWPLSMLSRICAWAASRFKPTARSKVSKNASGRWS
jgi:adenylate cyclase